jgi:hypothetical protein
LRAQRVDLGLGQVPDLGRRLDAGGSADQRGPLPANPVDVGQADDDVLVDRDIDAGNTRHG